MNQILYVSGKKLLKLAYIPLLWTFQQKCWYLKLESKLSKKTFRMFRPQTLLKSFCTIRESLKSLEKSWWYWRSKLHIKISVIPDPVEVPLATPSIIFKYLFLNVKDDCWVLQANYQNHAYVCRGNLIFIIQTCHYKYR